MAIKKIKKNYKINDYFSGKIMEKKLLKLVEFYNNLSESYNELYGEEQKEKWFYLLKLLKKYLENKNNKFLVVDLGCGIGFNYLKEFKQKNFPNLKLIGVDISFKSLIKNKENNYYDFLINSDINKFCFNKLLKKEVILISCSSLQNFDLKTIEKILNLPLVQIHSVMYKPKENFWLNLFKNKNFKFYKKIKNDLLFYNF